MKYEISGTFKVGGEMQNFTKVIEAESEKLAQLKVLCKLGSDHKTKRRNIEIKEVKENVENKAKQE